MPLPMIVDNTYIVGVSVPEAEDEAKLLVDSDAVEPFPVSRERFQVVPGRHTKIAQVVGRIQQIELPHGNTLQGRGQYCACGFGVDPVEKVFGASILEAGDHGDNVLL